LIKPFFRHNTHIGILPLKRIFYLKKRPLVERHAGRWEGIIIHHTGRTLSSLLDFHLNKKKWSKIGYHFVIDQKGEIIQTRSLRRRGAHAYFYNHKAIGIAFLKDLNKGDLPEVMKLACLRLIEELEKLNSIKQIQGHVQSQLEYLGENIRQIYNIKNEKDFQKLRNEIITKASEKNKEFANNFKNCPGMGCYTLLEELNKDGRKT